jgi:hypothetical protein
MAAVVYFSPIGNGQVFLASNALPANGGFINTYLAGTTTPADTYTTSAGTIKNSNPIVLTVAGLAPSEIWLVANVAYKFVVTDILGTQIGPPYDNLVGLNAISVGASVMQFGAVGDGVADDTAAIQAGITAMAGSVLWFPGLKFKISAALNVVNALTMVGVPYKTTLLLATQNQNGIVVGDGTGGQRTSASTTTIDGFAFNPFPGVTAFTSGSCIVRNNVFDVAIRRCIGFGQDSSVAKLWNFITDISSTDSDAIYCIASYFINNVVKVSGGSGALASGHFYNYLRYNNITGDALFVGTFIGGLTFTNPTGFKVGGWHFHMNSSTGANGNNVFISNPDWECDVAGTGAWVQQGNGVYIGGEGWIGGAGNTTLVWFGANSNACKIDGVALSQGQVLIDGPSCWLMGGSLIGDGSTSTTAVTVTSTAINGGIAGGLTISQYITSAVAFTSVPTNFKVQAHFNSIGSNATEITGSASANASPPDCRGCTTDASRLVAAASALPLNFGRDYIVVTGATAINTMTIKSSGERLIIQGGVAGITVNNGAGIVNKSGGNLTIGSGQIAEYFCDGNSQWIQIAQNF